MRYRPSRLEKALAKLPEDLQVKVLEAIADEIENPTPNPGREEALRLAGKAGATAVAARDQLILDCLRESS